MQTYLPYTDFSQSAKCLDTKRLNNQRNECFVLLDAIIGKPFKVAPEDKFKVANSSTFDSMAWKNHPVTKMWLDHPFLLFQYLYSIHSECCRRKIENSQEVQERILYYWIETYGKGLPYNPHWLGGFIHENHRAKLLSKDMEHYSQFNWEEEARAESWYPVPWGPKQEVGYGGAR